MQEGGESADVVTVESLLLKQKMLQSLKVVSSAEARPGESLRLLKRFLSFVAVEGDQQKQQTAKS